MSKNKKSCGSWSLLTSFFILHGIHIPYMQHELSVIVGYFNICDLFRFTGNITMPHVKIINLHVDINMLLVNIIMFYVDLNNSHVNIFVLLDA